MSTTDPTYDVAFVQRTDLPKLPTVADPSGVLKWHVPDPFGGGTVTSPKIAITVLSMLDEPVEAVAFHATSGDLGWVPVVRTDVNDQPDRSPTHEKAGDGIDGFGWIDPAGYPDLVAVGSWTVDCSAWGPIRKAGGVLHLRCTDSRVDILVGGLVAERVGSLGGWNPYNIELREPGTLHPSDKLYDDWFWQHVDSNATSDDREGHSSVAPVYYLARTPQGRTDWWWHILVFLGPRPIKDMWDAPPPSTAADDAQHRADDIEDWVQRLLQIDTTYYQHPDREGKADELGALLLKAPADLGLPVWKAYLTRVWMIANPGKPVPA